MKMNKKSKLFFILIISSSCVAQDTVSSGFYKQVLPNKFDKQLLEERCLEKARINAIENAFGFVVTDSSSLIKSHERINDKEKTKNIFQNSICTIITGRWLKDENPPKIDYFTENGTNWISVSVTGIVREIKPKNFNEDKEVMAEYLRELYTRSQFEGVKIVENNEQSFLISLVALEKSKYKNYSDLNTIARVKAQSQASKFINGSSLSSEDFIFTTNETSDKESIARVFESIKETSMGFVNGLELLTSFDSGDEKYSVHIFLKRMDVK